MSDIWWGTKTSLLGPAIGREPDNEDELLIEPAGFIQPDWVRIPAESPKDPGRQLRVLGVREGKCAKCKQPEVMHLVLEANYGVCDCPNCHFVFYETRPTEDSPKSNTPTV